MLCTYAVLFTRLLTCADNEIATVTRCRLTNVILQSALMCPGDFSLLLSNVATQPTRELLVLETFGEAVNGDYSRRKNGKKAES